MLTFEMMILNQESKKKTENVCVRKNIKISDQLSFILAIYIIQIMSLGVEIILAKMIYSSVRFLPGFYYGVWRKRSEIPCKIYESECS